MTAQADVGYHARPHARWHWSEIVFWILALACAFLFPSRYLIMTDIVRLALFALSLDLILGYAGIVSLGHAAFFGVGAYCAGLLALHGVITEPVLALVAGRPRRHGARLRHQLPGDPGRRPDPADGDARHRAVAGSAGGAVFRYHRRHRRAAGHRDAADPRPVRLRHVRQGRLLLLPRVLFLLFLLARRIVHSPFGLSLRAIRNNPLRAAAIGIPVNRRLIAVYTLAAFYAGIAGALFTQTTALASLDVFSFERSADLMLVLVIGGTGYLYGGLIGAVVFRMLQEVFSTITPQYWQFWIGLVLVVIVLVGRQRLHRWVLWAPNLVIAAVRRPQGRRCRSRERRAMTFALETRGLEKHFGGLKVTRDLSLRIAQGARHAADRAERRRQDHRHQSVDRRAQARCRAHPARRQRHHRSAGAYPRAARAVAHLPDQPALRRSDAARDHRACGVGAARPRRRLVAPDGHARRRQCRDRGKRCRASICSTS